GLPALRPVRRLAWGLHVARRLDAGHSRDLALGDLHRGPARDRVGDLQAPRRRRRLGPAEETCFQEERRPGAMPGPLGLTCVYGVTFVVTLLVLFAVFGSGGDVALIVARF